eukprot:CAMPEP_0197825734 /NCGR_PEP_ID=MMETSP1437-20131217/2770_1 /TAXON_ID=49252 ORGANISM="Eucampia antarctica, Strain CCMP1452" /NCGR_SAMPLE_ID=MMETSP1437 /ASSEMBLY_ACC=CAM_ASM_001096 /LENGTH=164 /DNA_ID=CAMNT_0043425865 /DNA_START=230 /DNA_END=724 /DNA_ORIENTATION=-
MKAVDCANSDSCSIDEARAYMNEIVHVQSGCVAGTLVGEDVCENSVFASEVIASLRQKIDNGVQKSTGSFGKGEFLVLISLYLVMHVSGLAHNSANDIMPFTTQEWMWGLRDGYLLDMLSYNFKHIGDGIEHFTTQEWWWALRDGYLPDVLAANFKNGGLLIEA